MRCPVCRRRGLTKQDFTIVRDGKRLNTAQCRHCLAEEDRKHNREQKRRARA